MAALRKGFVVFVLLGVIWLIGVVAFALVLLLPSNIPENQNAELTNLQMIVMVLLWPATVVVVLMGVNKFVREEYET